MIAAADSITSETPVPRARLTERSRSTAGSMTRVGSAASTVTRRVSPSAAHADGSATCVATSRFLPSSSNWYVGLHTVLPPWFLRPSSTMTASTVTGCSKVDELIAGLR